MSHLYNDIFSWILYPGERIDVQMGMELADFCHCIRETFLFLSPFFGSVRLKVTTSPFDFAVG